jgi:hypothetical protein
VEANWNAMAEVDGNGFKAAEFGERISGNQCAQTQARINEKRLMRRIAKGFL